MKKILLQLLFAFLSLSVTYGQTYVSGNITTNTSWATAGSPYIFTGAVYITSSATLDIQQNVDVDIGSYSLRVADTGTLLASGVTFSGGYIDFDFGSSGSIDGCTLDGTYLDIQSSPSITNNTIANISYPIKLKSGATPTISGNDLSGSTYQGIYWYGDIGADWTLPDYGLPYYLHEYLLVYSSATLTIGSGIEVDITSPYYVRVQGTLLASGVTFSGGYIDFDFGSSGSIDGCTLDGTYLDIQSSPSITNNTIKNCSNGIYCSGTPSPVIEYNDFVNNSYGIYNNSSSLIIAENNWWGSQSGPTHNSNPGGTGDAVTDNVDFTPWLIEPVYPENLISGGITVINPNGGETWYKERSYNISWISQEVSGSLKIELYNGDLLAALIDSAISIQSSPYAWFVPDSIPDGSEYKIRITSLKYIHIFDESDGPMAITISVPIALDDTVITIEDSSLLVDVLENDNDPGGFSINIASHTQGKLSPKNWTRC